MTIPPQCPECGTIAISVKKLPPAEHNQGETWLSRAECNNCNEYVEWFE